MTIVDKRKTRRVQLNSAATLQVLGPAAGSNGIATPVQVIDASERGMKVQAASPLSAGQAVKIEIGDSMFLGEVCHCAPIEGNPANGFSVGIMVQECLSGLSSLQHLIRALQPQSVNETERVR